jgi:hypothetical protein
LTKSRYIELIQFAEDQVNLVRHPQPNQLIYYESNNIVVRINGKSKDALLLSSHYDSTPSSNGATDDGMGVASMISIFHALARKTCTTPIPNTVVFNFNNGEEDGLNGGSAFTKHQWFPNIKAFINLEGTGAKPHSRSFIFRTNSFEMMDKISKTSPYPHTSIIANAAMGFIGSDTDFRPYSTIGNLPGVDFAFYAHRYFYHTRLDNIDKASGDSLQHMADNVYSAMTTMIYDNKFFAIKLDPEFQSPPYDMLPIPKFSFYDRFGHWSVVQSNSSFILLHLVTIVILGATVVTRTMSFYHHNGSLRLMNYYLKPGLNSFLLVCFAFWFSILVAFGFGYVKGILNPGINYGYPEYALAANIALVFASVGLSLSIWPRISKLLGLFKHSDHVELDYTPLPETPADDEDEDEEDLMVGDVDTPLSRSSVHRDVHDRKSKSITAWLPAGLASFWMCCAIFSLLCSLNGVSVFYFLFDFFLFSTISILLGFMIEAIFVALIREDINTEYSPYEQMFVDFYSKNFWIFQLLVSNVVPFMFLIDIFRLSFDGFPSLVNEGLPDRDIDLVFSTLSLFSYLNFMPLLSKSSRLLSTVCFFLLFLALWIPQTFFIFPFSATRPVKFNYQEVFDLNLNNNTTEITITPVIDPKRFLEISDYKNIPTNHTLTQSSIRFSHHRFSHHIPNFDPIQHPHIPKDLEIQWQKQIDHNKLIITGQIISPSQTRICDLFFSNPGLLWIDKKSKYKSYETNEINPMIENIPGMKVTVYKRNFNMGEKIAVPFGFKSDHLNVTISVECRFSVEYSEFYDLYEKGLPAFALASLRSGTGAFVVKKQVSI